MSEVVIPMGFTAIEATRSNAKVTQVDGEPNVYSLTVATLPNWEIKFHAVDDKTAVKFFTELAREAEVLADFAVRHIHAANGLEQA